MSRKTPSLQFPVHAADNAATSAAEGTAEPIDLSDGREWPRVWLSLALSLVIYVPLALALAAMSLCDAESMHALRTQVFLTACVIGLRV